MGKALYRTHRSKKLSDVIGQDHITTTLQRALDQGKISHAYLFTGPRGVGKTSVARILAHEINKLPYTDETQHIDIIEIDAASNRRIDEIRELRDTARLSPLSAPYKVFIIDEVHMLTREAFNALLKTLEEPPDHVIFILATTEAHKLPETIISRTQRYSFKPIATGDAVGHLKSIAKKEKLSIDDDALQLIAAHGNGSFRDAISLLDQIGNTQDTVDAAAVRAHLGVPPEEMIEACMKAILTHEPKIVIELLSDAQDRGYQAPLLAQALASRIRQVLLEGGMPRQDGMRLLGQLLDVPSSNQPYEALELALLDVTLKDVVAAPSRTAPQVVAKKETTISVKPKKPVRKTTEEPTFTPNENADVTKLLDEKLWDRVLDTLRGKHNTLYGIARMASVSADGNTLVLGFAFSFHMRRFNEPRNQEKLQAIITEVCGQPLMVRCEVDPKSPKEPVKAPQKETPKSGTLDSITKVFGGGEVLED